MGCKRGEGRLQWLLRVVKRPLNPRAAIGDDADLF